MKPYKLLALSLVLTLLAVTALSCGFSVSTANIRSATLAKGYENGEAVDATTTFAPSDLTLHLVVKVGNAPDDTTLRAEWSIVEVEGYEASAIDATDLTLSSGEDTADFTLANNDVWPAGKYKVDLYLNDKLDRTLEFEVVE